MAKNINRDYKIYISLLEAPNKGQIKVPKSITFIDTDQYTQNIYLIADTEIIDLEFLLAFRYNNELIKLTGVPAGSNTVEFNLPNLTVAGKYEAEIVAIKGEEILVCDDFTFVVKNSIVNGGGKNG